LRAILPKELDEVVREAEKKIQCSTVKRKKTAREQHPFYCLKSEF